MDKVLGHMQKQKVQQKKERERKQTDGKTRE